VNSEGLVACASSFQFHGANSLNTTSLETTARRDDGS
jgi:hypothetical protein